MPYQIQDSTHKGGAVLWFLRKHAPMPIAGDEHLEGPNLANVAHTVAAAAGASAAVKQNFVARGNLSVVSAGLEVEMEDGRLHEAFVSKVKESNTAKSAGRKVQVGRPRAFVPKQARLLHSAIASIGVELDEARPGIAAAVRDGFVGAEEVARGGERSMKCREHLRQQYAEHAGLECAQLREQVAKRNAEVEALRKTVEHLQRTLSITRMAATRRKKRFKDEQGAGTPGDATASDGSVNPASVRFTQLLKMKTQFMKTSSAVVYDHERARTSYKLKGVDFEESLKAKLDEHWAQQQEMRGTLEDQSRLYQQQLIQRKATEAALFGKRTEILQLRAQTLKAEARVTRLANDLRRVYKQMPEVVRQKLDMSAPQRNELRARELEGLHGEHQIKHFKWLSREQLGEQIRCFEVSQEEMAARTAAVEQALDEGKEMGKAALRSSETIVISSNSLLEAWSQLLVPLTSGVLNNRDKDAVRGASEEVNCLAADMDILLRSTRETLAMIARDMKAASCDDLMLPTQTAATVRSTCVW